MTCKRPVKGFLSHETLHRAWSIALNPKSFLQVEDAGKLKRLSSCLQLSCNPTGLR